MQAVSTLDMPSLLKDVLDADALNTFVQRYLDLVARTGAIVHHRHAFGQMLDLLEEQMLVHLSYRNVARRALSGHATGLPLKEGVNCSCSATVRDVRALINSDGFIVDEGTHFLSQCLSRLRGESIASISDEVAYACLAENVSAAVLLYPASPWLRCLLAILSLADGSIPDEASLGFLDASLLLRELKDRDQRVHLLATIMRYCDL